MKALCSRLCIVTSITFTLLVSSAGLGQEKSSGQLVVAKSKKVASLL